MTKFKLISAAFALTLSTGALIAVQGYNTLSNVGIEALTGFLSAFLNVRFIAPATSSPKTPRARANWMPFCSRKSEAARKAHMGRE